MHCSRLLCLIAALLAIGPAALAAPGDVNELNAIVFGTDDFLAEIGVQPDGKIIIAGVFTSVLGVPRHNIARLNADGTLDMEFDPSPNNTVGSVAVQADGKVVLGGEFTTLKPNGAAAATARNCIARVHADGTLDTSFDPNPNEGVDCLAVQPDGKVIFGGEFTSVRPNGTVTPVTRRYIARTNADGSLDTGFDPNANDWVNSLAIQADGKIVLGGLFTTLRPNGAGAPVDRQSVARINADGTLDSGFDPRPDDSVYTVAVQADGKVLIGGGFTTLQPNGSPAAVSRQRIARVNANGTLDTGFNPRADSWVFTMAAQADGKIVIGGFFTTLRPNAAPAPVERRYIARLHADGSLDTAFNPRADGRIHSVTLQADGKVLAGGYFSSLQPNGAPAPLARRRFARLESDPAVEALSLPGPSQVVWQRGGSAPDLSHVSFDVSTDGGLNWNPLGPGNRMGSTSNWQGSGLVLPSSGWLRARGAYNGGGLGNSSLIEQTITFSHSGDSDNDGLPDAWELSHWPVVEGHNAPDDFDHDGYPELLELALGLNPTVSNPGGLPPVVVEDGFLTMTIAKRPGVICEVQSAGTLIPGLPDSFSAAGTTVLIDDSVTLKVRDNVPVSAQPGRFMRLKVTANP